MKDADQSSPASERPLARDLELASLNIASKMISVDNGFNKRCVLALRRADIYTFEKLLSTTEEDLKRGTGIGKRTIELIKEVLQKHGLTLFIGQKEKNT